MPVLELDRAFGLVIADAVVMWGLNFYLGGKVMNARNECGVKLPLMYENKDDSKFNCVQRSHMNYVENSSFTLSLLFCGGLCAPRVSAAAGAVHIVGKVLYAQGYSTGNPSMRSKGNIAYLGLFTLVGTSIYSALKIGQLV
mmetsp:Transcript_6389/g.13629  ORF Transcript_6389/g.13629 Transcript_6389/m.13629 type:complete len:141 (+) Transcript_6389:51-473(+)